MNNALTFILLFLYCSIGSIIAQIPYRVMWYNVENLFDTKDNPERNDNEFLPDGARRWSNKRYYHKLQQIAKVINAAGEWDIPALVGLCEVENDSVLFHLLNRTPLRHQQYRYCISESSDARGINVALLYQRDKFRMINYHNIPVPTGKNNRSIRNLLHVWGEIINGDTLDILLAHFPSRYGGEKESESKRFAAATTLRSVSDSLQQLRNNPYLLIMGDMNDNPEDKSICEYLSAIAFYSNKKKPVTKSTLYNIIPNSTHKQVKGTHKYQGEWSQLDHMIVNDNLIDMNSPFRLQKESIHIYSPSFLLTNDKTWRGVRPKRTYYGFKYEAGYSDHLPLIADFLLYLSGQARE